MFHVKHEGLLTGSAGRPLTEVFFRALEVFTDLVVTRAMPKGMVAPTDPDTFISRHVADSLRVVPHIGSATTLADLGSGAGLPGIPVALACPELSVSLVEQRRQRVAFLEYAVETLGLQRVTVVHGAASKLAGRFDVVTARALGDVGTTWRLAAPLIAAEGRLIYFAGASFDRRDLPADTRATIETSSGVANVGPLVIMARQ
jgi:16S rRNA (guanine527-N7)-methyltransferase